MGGMIEIKCGMHSELPQKTIIIILKKVEIQPRKKIDKFQLELLGGISKILFVITRNYSNQPN